MATYEEQLLAEGSHWHNLSLELLSQGVIPYCGDFRLHLTQLVLSRRGRAFHLGAGLVPTRFREVRNVLGAVAESVARGGRDVVDLGCGAGWLSLEIARLGGRVRGLDVSRDNLELARFFAERHPASLPHLHPRFAGFPLGEMGEAAYEYGDLNGELRQLPTGSADVVVVWDSLHHVRDLGTTFGEVCRVLRPGGFFVGHDYVGPGPEAEAARRPLLHAVRELFACLSGDELRALRRQAVRAAQALPLGENAVDGTTRFGDETARYVDGMLSELQSRFLHGRERAAVPSPFEEVSVGYLLTELRAAFDLPAFYSMGAFWPEDMPPPADDPGDEGGLLFHYLSFMSLALDDLLVDAGYPGRYVCFVGVPRGRGGRTPGFVRTLPSPGRATGGAAGAGAAAGTVRGEEAEELRARVRLLEAENRVLRQIAGLAHGPAADARRVYVKVLRPALRRLLRR